MARGSVESSCLYIFAIIQEVFFHYRGESLVNFKKKPNCSMREEKVQVPTAFKKKSKVSLP